MKDVAIAGAGPTGIVAANLCGRYGLSVVAFDREPGVYDLPRAAGMYDDVQRLLDNAGLLEPIRPSCRAHVGAEFVDAAGKRLIGIEFAGIATLNGYPPVLAIAQPQLEAAWRKCLAESGDVELCVSHDVCEIDEFDDYVEIVVRDRATGGSRRERARWLIGADGANSFVRKHCGISWDSLGYDREWLVIDVERDPSVALPPFCQQLCDPARPTTLVPMPGHQYRWEFQLKPGETREEMQDRDRVWELLRPWLTREQGSVLRAVVYRFHATIAADFRHGRIFLAGDAAHQTPPFMGQGLCTGLRDAENLAWKLAAVQGGEATDALLDTYGEERHPAAVAMVQHSTNTGKLIDAYAQMTITGIPPPPELVEYGYGGGKQLPDISTGLLGSGGSAWIGRRMPQCGVRRDGQSGRLDALAGRGWAIVSVGDADAVLGEDGRRAWEALGATFLQIEDPHAASLLGERDVAILRPDRIVFSLGTEVSVPAPYLARAAA